MCARVCACWLITFQIFTNGVPKPAPTYAIPEGFQPFKYPASYTHNESVRPGESTLPLILLLLLLLLLLILPQHANQVGLVFQ